MYLWQGLWFAVLFAPLLLPMVPLLRFAFAKFGHAPELLNLEASYLRIVIYASVIKLTATALGQFLLAVNRPNVVFASAVAGVSANAVVAFALILGKLGFPRLGVTGAALAQNIGVTVEMLTLLSFVLRPSIRKTYNLNNWQLRPSRLKTLLRLGIPSGVQVASDVLAWSLFTTAAIGTFGTAAMAANTYMFRYMSVSFMPALGIASAVTALVGRSIGRGDRDQAAHWARLAFRLTTAYMFACGLLFYFARNPLMSLFTRDPNVHAIGTLLLTFAAVYQVFDAMYIVYNGALRGAGDTFLPGLITGLLCWGVMLFGGYFVARKLPQFGVAGPWSVASAYGIILGFFMLIRFRLGGWKLIRLEAHPPSITDAAFATVPDHRLTANN